ASAQLARGQAKQLASVPGGFSEDLREFVETPAVSGYEGELVEKIRAKLAAFRPAVDNLGDITVTLGRGAPRRLIVTPIDEPGYIVSEITDDGYLRLQRLPQGGLPVIFNSLCNAQPVKVRTTSGKWLDGVTAGLSVHLQGERANAPKPSEIENLYVDIGASSAAEARKAGVDILSPVVIERQLRALGYGKDAGASIGDRFGATALVELLRQADPTKIPGTLIVAFVVQQRTGARGLQRIISTVPVDEMIYVGRLLPGGPVAGSENFHHAPRRDPGSGVLLGLEKTGELIQGLPRELQVLAGAINVPFAVDYSAAIIPQSYLPAPAIPERYAHLGIATAWHDTPGETIDFKDLIELWRTLDSYFEGSRAGQGVIPGFSARGGGHVDGNYWPGGVPPQAQVLKELIQAYGASKHETPVREKVQHFLPPWAKTESDDAGNLILHVGTAPPGSKTPKILIIAHMDEIGFEVKSISKDGRLEVEWLGRGEMNFYAGHPALVHAAAADQNGVVELPSLWDEPNFEWPREPGRPIRVDVGARTPEEAAQLGIKIGDSVTIPKSYRPLLGTRANGRSFDDRVGDAALISAVWALGGTLKDRDITLVWSTREELGLEGAAALAKRFAADGKSPDYVFAVDTFVSADSPIESKRFADATLGKGFVVRAVDNSNIVPPELVEKVLKLARANQIPAQYGATGGGNDGAAFVRYGSVDLALGWPLRYSHSPAEVIDTRDLDALARIVAAVARSW
ncbi:MAG TPA: M20/M25/M40 family metallo-hydrolase, partial [Candidatus Limnocylindrales bacterium]|nr:M20/M25/M40 family metallo-hydrolase [Candidatus Limnocylindrales bacterium]